MFKKPAGKIDFGSGEGRIRPTNEITVSQLKNMTKEGEIPMTGT